MISKYQFIPSSILDETRKRQEANEWAAGQRAILAQEWADNQRRIGMGDLRALEAQSRPLSRQEQQLRTIGEMDIAGERQWTPQPPSQEQLKSTVGQLTERQIEGASRMGEIFQRLFIEPTTNMLIGPTYRSLTGQSRPPAEEGPLGFVRTAAQKGIPQAWQEQTQQWEETAEPFPGVKGAIEMVNPLGAIAPTRTENPLAALSEKVRPLAPAMSVEKVGKGKKGETIKELGEEAARTGIEEIPEQLQQGQGQPNIVQRLLAEEAGSVSLPQLGKQTPTSANPATQAIFDMYYGQPAAPTTGKSVKDKLSNFVDWTVRQTTNRKIAIDKLTEEAARVKGAPLTEAESANLLARLNPDKAAEVRLQEGLRPALLSVGDDQPWLSAYLTHRHDVDIAAAKGNAARKFSGGRTAADSQQALIDMATELGPQRMQQVKQSAQQIDNLVDQMRERLVQSGVWSRELADQLKQQYPHYVPTRILDYMAQPENIPVGKGLSMRDKGIRALTVEGTEKAREDPLASVVRLVYQTEARARQNDVFNAFRNLRDILAKNNPAWADKIKEVPNTYKARIDEHVITGFVDGKKVTYAVPRDLGLAYDYVTPNPGFAIRGAMTLFKMGATGRNPLFLSSNAIMDAMTYFARESIRSGGPQNLPKVVRALGQAYVDAFKGLPSGQYAGKATSEYLKSGGGIFGFYQSAPEATKATVRELSRRNAIDIRNLSDLKGAIADLATLKPIEKIGERIELAPRVASYKLARARGEGAAQSAIRGKTVTMNFDEGGEFSMYLNQFIPFFNVGTQAPAQVVRAFKENPKAFIGTAATLLAGPTVATEAWNRSDPQRARDYADVPQYIKDQGIVIMLPGEAPVDEQGNRRPQFVFLRTREYTPFVTLTREAVSRAMGDDPREWADLIGRGVLNTVSPVQGGSAAEAASGILPPIVGTGIQLAADKDLYRDKMIATKYGDEQASAISKGIAGAVGARPSQVEFAIRDIGSGVAGMGLAAGDIATGQQAGATPQEAPVVGGVLGRFVRGNIGGRLDKAQQETLSDEAQQILRQGGVEMTISPAGRTIRNVPLTMEEQAYYQGKINQYTDKAIKELAKRPQWGQATPEQREEVVKSVLTKLRAQIADAMIQVIGAEEVERRLRKEFEKAS